MHAHGDAPRQQGKRSYEDVEMDNETSKQHDLGRSQKIYGDDEQVAWTEQLQKLEKGLTEKCHHYQARGDVPWDIQKYWEQRYSIWSAYDHGIYMTDDAWFGVTPEPVAVRVASDLMDWIETKSCIAAENGIEIPERKVIIDIFAGAGGNCIQFALSGQWGRVVAIEKDADTLACAKINAHVYGVYDKITFIHSDCFKYVADHLSLSPGDPYRINPEETVIFASPPWGGPQYKGDKVFNLDTMEPYSGQVIHELVKGMDHALFLPRTSDLRQIGRMIPDGQEEKIEVVQYCMEGASKALVAYVPALVEGKERE